MYPQGAPQPDPNFLLVKEVEVRLSDAAGGTLVMRGLAQ